LVLIITLIERPYLFETIIIIIIMRTTPPPTPLPTSYAQIVPAQVYKGRNTALCHRQE